MTQLIIGFILTVVGAGAGILDKWKNNKEKRSLRNNWIASVLLLVAVAGGILTLSGGIEALHARATSDQLASERQLKIDSQGQLIYRSELVNQNLIDTNLQYSRRLDSSTALNYRLSFKIADQATQVSDYLSGKGSFCYLELGARDPNTNSYPFELYSAGRNPMDNVVADIIDVFNIRSGGFGSLLHIGKVFPKIHTVRLFQTTYTPIKKDSIWLDIIFQTNGRQFDEELKEIYLNGKWRMHMEVIGEGKVLVDRTDSTFPRSWLK